MKWFKNVVARIMGDEIEEYDNEKKNNNDRIEYNDTYEEYIEQEFDTAKKDDHVPAFLRKRDAFRFPVISDAERSQMIDKESPRKQSPQQSNRQARPKPQATEQGQWNNQRQRQHQDRFQAPDQEQAPSQMRRQPLRSNSQQSQEPTHFGTREQRRPTSTNRYNEVPVKQERINPFNPTPSYDTKKTYGESPSTPNSRRATVYEDKASSDSKPEQVKKQKFKPTNVPSPVYGFQKPPMRSIYDQLEDKNLHEQQLSGDNVEVTEQAVTETVEPLNVRPIVEQVSVSVPVTDELKVTEVQAVEEEITEEVVSESVVVEAVEEEEPVNHEQIIATPTISQPEEEQFQQTATTEQEPVEAMEMVATEEIASEPVVVEAVEEEEPVNHEQIIVTPTTSQPEEKQFQQTATTEQEPVEAMEVVATEEIASEPVVVEAVEKEEPVIQEQIIVTPTITQPVEEQFQQQKPTVAVQEREEDLEQNQEVKLVGQAQTYGEELTIEEKPAIIEEVIYRAEEPEELATSENVSEEAPALVLDSIEIPMDPIKVHKQLDEMSSPTGEEVPTAIAEPVRTEESKLPFNVLMLKTDKEKWAAKEAKFKHDFQAEVVEHDTSITVIEKLMETKATTQSKQFTELEQPIAQNYEEAAATTVEQVIEAAVEEPEPSRINENLDTSLQYLEPPEEKTEDFEWMDMQGGRLIEALSYFQVKGEIVQIVQGPAVTQFEITVGHGTKVSKIRNLADDLKLALAAKDIRIQAPIPGKSSIGIEIPNRSSRPVRISEIVGDHLFIDSDSPLEAALGLDLTGKPVTLDLRKMPHGLIAGATGSGKSVCINSILVSLLLKASPQDVKLLLIDPKMVELAAFNHIPHLVSPVITDVKAATAALKWAVEEMERRYQLFAHLGARDITRYNAMVEAERKFSLKMPYLVIVIDELADLMMMAPTDVEEAICRIAQKARACGMHLVLATQRPSVDVITGLIKSNIPTRIAFSVSSHIDSRTILDSQGAERLLGRGDMLYLGNGMSAPIRVQGTFVTDEEIEAVTGYMRSLGKPEYIFEQDELLKRAEAVEEQDELFEEACRHICEQGTVSTSSLQRKFHIGYNRAARLVDMMEAQGFISESKGTKPRDVFLKTQDLENLFNNAYDEM